MPSLSLLYLLDEVGLPSHTSKVLGHQWYWSYECSDSIIAPGSSESYLCSGPHRLLEADHCLQLQSELILRLLISSLDVLHSWTVPSFCIKVDAVPGRLNILSTILSRSGVFYGQCSEICGSNHSFMPIKVEVLR